MPFHPPRWLTNGHLMTVVGNVARRPPRVVLARERWELPDGDFLDVDRSAGATPDAPLAILCHGLEGSSRAHYVLGTIARLEAAGVAALAVSFRGCSGEPNRLPRSYHSGDTGDLALVVERMVRAAPGRPLALMGFSLGGNVVTKYLGERGSAAPVEVRAAAVLSTPFDLARCCEALDGPGLPALIYRERFLRPLRRKALALARRFPGLLDEQRVRAARRLRDFDDAVTAPLHGFASAADYYARASSGPLLPLVARPLLVISAEDDPFIPAASLPRAALRDNPNITALLSTGGGHVGFVSGPPWRLRRWAEERMAEFVAARLTNQ